MKRFRTREPKEAAAGAPLELVREAKQGSPAAQFELGYLLYQGERGVRQDAKLAQKWLSKAAAQDVPRAMLLLGVLLKATRAGRRWTAKALKTNDPFVRAYCLSYGVGTTERDPQAAVVDYRRAAAGDEPSAQAQNNLGVCYARGDGVARDVRQAVAWYEKACAQDLPVSMVNLVRS